MEDGASSVEYGIFAALVAAVIAGMVALVGLDVLALYQAIQGRF